MQLYTCKVRLHGSLLHEVRKENVTAAEMHVLRVIHGADAVVEIEHTGKKDARRTDATERERLHHEYGAALASIDDVKSLNGIFGVAGALPEAMQGVPLLKAGSRPVGRPPKDPAPVADDLDLADEDDLKIPEFETT